jgi:hypothetical protein
MRLTGWPANPATAVEPCGSAHKFAPFAIIGVPLTSHTRAGEYDAGAAGAGGGDGAVAGGFGDVSAVGAGSTLENGRPSFVG